MTKETEAEKIARLRALREARSAGKPKLIARDYPPLGPDDEMPFGKYRGDPVSHVLEVEPNYLRWLLENKPGFSVTEEVEEELR